MHTTEEKKQSFSFLSVSPIMSHWININQSTIEKNLGSYIKKKIEYHKFYAIGHFSRTFYYLINICIFKDRVKNETHFSFYEPPAEYSSLLHFQPPPPSSFIHLYPLKKNRHTKYLKFHTGSQVFILNSANSSSRDAS